MKRLSNLGLSLLLTGLVTMAIAIALVPAVTGTKAVTIDRNSMQRLLPLGSLAYIRSSPVYRTGDIVTYQWNGNTVTHQIVALVPNPATAQLDGSWLQTRGTSNTEPDQPIPAASIVGRVIYWTPYAGTALKVLSTPVVIAFIGLLATGLYLLGRKTDMTQIRDFDDNRDDADLTKTTGLDEAQAKHDLEATMTPDHPLTPDDAGVPLSDGAMAQA